MKKQFLVLLAITLSSVCFAGTRTEGPGIINRETRLSSAIKKLVVKGPVDVVLYEDTSRLIITEGRSKNASAVVIEEKNGTLTISNRAGRAVVYLPVAHLEMIEAYGTARISSCTTLESPRIVIAANDYSTVAIRSRGQIIIEEPEDTELRVERTMHTTQRSTDS